jgi:hypothetical protein
MKNDDVPPAQSPLSQLETALIDDFLSRRGYDSQRLDALSSSERTQLLREASIYACARLTEVESRSHFIDDMHSGGSAGPRRTP